MPTHQVNLDALIQREDFNVSGVDTQGTGRLSKQLKLIEIENQIHGLLRKPDFQRETSGWTPQRIVDFVRSFVEGDLIPAVIMWRSSHSGKSFVIDGAHRLSALVAWVEDDYGDGAISREFWGHAMSGTQIKLAKLTRELVARQIGAYADLKRYLAKPNLAPDEAIMKRARDMNQYAIDLQWVEGTPEKAQESFIKINGNAVVIDKTEMAIIRARKKPNAIATRALMNCGTGHKYWSEFPVDRQSEIENLAKEIYETLFAPILETPIKSTELPIAGQAYSATAFQFILDLVNYVNDISDAMWQEPKASKAKQEIARLDDDKDGTQTLAFLENVKKAASLISGMHPGSLGLHPAVYYYSQTEKVHTPAILATIGFALELKQKNQFRVFTKHRKDFEDFLADHRHFASSLSHRYGARTRPVEAFKLMYQTILQCLRDGKTDHEQIRDALYEVPQLANLRGAQDRVSSGTRMSKSAKSESVLRASLDSAIRCPNCKARLHSRSMTIDHKVRKQEGGRGTADNAQPMHPFCNSGDKEAEAAALRRSNQTAKK